MAMVLCPTCGTRRVGSFRFCLSCGLDYDATVEPRHPEASLQDAAPGSSDSRKRARIEGENSSKARSMAVMLGRDLNIARRRRGLTQAQLGRSMGLSGARIGELERGDGATAPLDVWVRLGEAMNRPLAVGFSREADAQEPDARLLAAQEVLLDLARQHRRRTDVELPTRLADPARSIDVVLQDDAAHSLIIIEIWNTLDDLQEAAHSTSFKLADASGPAALAAEDGLPYEVTMCWLLVDRATNRRLVAESPEILEPRFTGSSVRWVRCLGSGAPPPTELGLAWIDTRRGRIVPYRRRRRT